MVAVFAVSIACLQVVARVALLCGLAAAVLNEVRCASNACFIEGSTCGAALAILVRQASYLVMYSSHSATPVSGAVEAVVLEAVFAGAVVVVLDVVVVVEVVFAGLLAVVVVLFVAVPPQPNEIAAKHRAAATNRIFLIFITC